MPKVKTTVRKRKVTGRMGRKPLPKAKRKGEKILASFTAAQRKRLENEAEKEGVTLSELVAQRAVGA